MGTSAVESKPQVGEVVRCRPLGAVCLIDEGQADWKILVVNADEGPGKDLRSMAEVENMWPGRTREILTWMDAQHKSAAFVSR